MSKAHKGSMDIKCGECEGTGNESNDHGGNCVYCEGFGTVKKNVLLKWLGSKLVTEDEYDEAVDRGEYEIQQQRDGKYE